MARGLRPDHGTGHRHPRRRLHRARRDPGRGHGTHHALCGSVQEHALPHPSASPSRWPRPQIAADAPEGDDMTASAGAAAAAFEGLATTARGETAGARAAVVIVSRDPGAREILHRELSKRYGADYQIAVWDRPAELESLM